MSRDGLGRWWVCAVVVLAAGLSAGCADLRLYSAVRDKQGIAAKEAWTGVDLAAVATAERANLKKLLEAELDTQDRLAAGIRNHELRSMVEAKTLKAGLVDPVKGRLDKVAGGSAAVADSRAKLAAVRTNQLRLESLEDEFKVKRLAVPSCESVADEQTPAAIESWRRSALALDVIDIDESLKRLRMLCAKPEADVVASVYAGLGGEVGTARVEYADAREQQRTSEKRAADLQKTYRAAQAKYEAALADSDNSSQALEKMQAALKDLDAAVQAVASASDALSIQFLSKERLDALDKFVKAVTEAKGDGKVPKDAGKAATAFILLPQLLDDAHQALADAKKPLALPLLMRRNVEQLRFEGATREVEARRAYVRLSREILDALYDQAVQLWLADRDLADAKILALRDKPMTSVFSAASVDEKELLYIAAARYLDAVNRLTARRYKLEYLRIASVHEMGLAYAEVNMKQWQALIGSTVDQVAAASGSGIKVESLNALINTLGVLWIGHGVSQ